jgi:putative proteasome-type protease
MLVDTGLVLLADSRTNAGVDQINTFRKIAVFQKPGERVMVLLCSGNLAATQAVMTLLYEHIDIGIWTAANMFEAARAVGDAIRAVHARDAAALQATGHEFNPVFILGGQIRGEVPRLFNLYSAGNFIEATPDTPYFQIGESKYGRPIIDRVLSRSSSLAQAAKCALISMDSTIRSNLSVGPPLDLAVIRRDEYKLAAHLNIEGDNEYFKMIRSQWGITLREGFSRLPDIGW